MHPGIISLQPKHPVVPPDFLHEQVQRALTIVTSARHDVDVVETTPEGVAVIDP